MMTTTLISFSVTFILYFLTALIFFMGMFSIDFKNFPYSD